MGAGFSTFAVNSAPPDTDAAVGLTQIAIWVAMGGVLAAYGAAAALTAGVNLGQFLRPALASDVLARTARGENPRTPWGRR